MYQVLEYPGPAEDVFTPRGAIRDFWRTHAFEVMVSGPAETGKTFGCLHKLDGLLWKYAGAQAVIIRKTLNSLYTTVFQTYKKVLGTESPVSFYGGEKPEWADYPNSSRVFFAGMDNPQKALSSERDFIYVNQAEELLLDDWETLTTRCTGRAGNAPYSQISGDCNPGPPTHWILSRASLLLLESRHTDNPTLYDDAGNLTPQGRRSIAILDALTGARKDRLRFGRWVQAEGVVYENWDTAVHLIDRFPIPADWPRIWGVDFGYTNPFVWGAWAKDPDGRLYLTRELYKTKTLVEDHAERIKALTKDEPRPVAIVCDHDAEDRATLERKLGLPTIPAYKGVTAGIQAVQERLRTAGDGKPRLFVFRDSLLPEDVDTELAALRKPVCTAQEYDVYVWAKGLDGKPVKEEPVKANDHGLDKTRYVVAYVDNIEPQEIVVGVPPSLSFVSFTSKRGR